MLCFRCGSYNPENTARCSVCGQEFIDGAGRNIGPARKATATATATPAIIFAPGELVGGRYKILELIGQGGVGAVYRVRDTENSVDLALKGIAPNLLQTDEEQKAFSKAIKGARKLQHNNIVRLYDEGAEGPRRWFTMKLLEGLTLRKIIRLRHDKGQPFSVEEIIPIFQQLGAALDHAHKSTWHGDLKPENVIVLPDLLKITDFGLVKGLPLKPFLGIAKTRSKGFPYIAPELRVESQSLDGRVDVYSLGVMLAEMLTGIVYEGHFTRAFTAALEQFPTRLDGLVRRALADHPDGRFAKAGEMVAEVEDALSAIGPAGLPAPARPVQSPTPGAVALAPPPAQAVVPAASVVEPPRAAPSSRKPPPPPMETNPSLNISPTYDPSSLSASEPSALSSDSGTRSSSEDESLLEINQSQVMMLQSAVHAAVADSRIVRDDAGRVPAVRVGGPGAPVDEASLEQTAPPTGGALSDLSGLSSDSAEAPAPVKASPAARTPVEAPVPGRSPDELAAAARRLMGVRAGEDTVDDTHKISPADDDIDTAPGGRPAVRGPLAGTEPDSETPTPVYGKRGNDDVAARPKRGPEHDDDDVNDTARLKGARGGRAGRGSGPLAKPGLISSGEKARAEDLLATPFSDEGDDAALIPPPLPDDIEASGERAVLPGDDDNGSTSPRPSPVPQGASVGSFSFSDEAPGRPSIESGLGIHDALTALKRNPRDTSNDDPELRDALTRTSGTQTADGRRATDDDSLQDTMTGEQLRIARAEQERTSPRRTSQPQLRPVAPPRRAESGASPFVVGAIALIVVLVVAIGVRLYTSSRTQNNPDDIAAITTGQDPDAPAVVDAGAPVVDAGAALAMQGPSSSTGGTAPVPTGAASTGPAPSPPDDLEATDRRLREEMERREREDAARTAAAAAGTPHDDAVKPDAADAAKPDAPKPDGPKPDAPKPDAAAVVAVASGTCPKGMATIEAGSFSFGSSGSDPMRNFGELDAQSRELPTYCIDYYEAPNGKDDLPTTGVSWQAAKNACDRAGKRLCSEAEWERACKGPGSARFPYGNTYDTDVCNTEDGDGKARPLAAAVEFKKCRSGFKVFALSGNAEEWVADGQGGQKVAKGGSSDRPDFASRCSARRSLSPKTSSGSLGFRCCADPK